MSYAVPARLPDSLIKQNPTPKLHLYTSDTPNGYKVSIALEELLLAYPENRDLAYDFQKVTFDNLEQKQPAFLEINPNGRIPALVDDNHGHHRVFESASILLWLVSNYDPEHKFWFTDSKEISEAYSWIFFGHGGIGPMQGQSNHFTRYAPEKIPYAIKRYQDETKRLYGVLNTHLEKTKQEYILRKFSIVDISMFGWVRKHAWAGVDNEQIKAFPALVAWLDRIETRPGTYAGLGIPARGRKKTAEEEEKEAKEASAWIFKGLEHK